MSYRMVGLVGKKGSGKTTVAKHLEKYGYKREQFAKPLKSAAKEIFLLQNNQLYNSRSKEQVDSRWGLTPRQILQRLGTEVVREFDEDIWVKSLECRIGLEKCSRFVIEDCRFKNEGDFVKRNNGILLKLVGRGSGSDNHASESLSDIHADYRIDNSGTFEDLYEQVEKIVLREDWSEWTGNSEKN